ncbi:uncharacterized protein LOC127467540 isoform X5 [Manacus candei]|uniref:uncharacterized protein LOC127467540 isoform X5 n=1 Tax=Manacus candei TaxID=415023 RepID=UPI0022272A02|nr:uncharacterized protein LOC127467540 isoform X5 [Manacus candei]
MVCERISLCLGRKLFDPQKSQTTSRARGTNFRRRHIVIPSLISFTMHSVQARIYLTVQAVAARIGAAFAQCFVPGILRRARERERRQASWSSSEKEQEP